MTNDEKLEIIKNNVGHYVLVNVGILIKPEYYIDKILNITAENNGYKFMDQYHNYGSITLYDIITIKSLKHIPNKELDNLIEMFKTNKELALELIKSYE